MSIGYRLKEERKRLAMDQAAFGNLGGVQAVAQSNYENDKRYPDASYLERVAAAGVDVLYVVTGQRALTEQQVFDDVKRMCDAWETLELALEKVKRTLTPAKKRKAAEALYRASKAQVGGASQEQLTALVLELAA